MLADDTSQPGVLLWDSAALDLSITALNGLLEKCREDMLGYTIYPRDPFDIADISALLASFPNVVPHNSISGFGMLYWTADLSQEQLIQVKVHKQVRSSSSRHFPEPNQLIK
jgi:hypothetical protein